MTNVRTFMALLAALGLWACDDGRVETDAGAGAPDAASSGADAGVVGTDAGAVGTDAGEPPPPTDGGPTTGGGTVMGNVTRTAMPAAGGRGHLYIAVFTSDPVTDRMGAMQVANVRVEDVDMSGAGASIPYVLRGVPPRAEPYFVTAFLDDNGNVDISDPSRAGPDRGDLVALEGFASPRVTVPNETPVTLDLVLNFNLPF
ncbi:MAG: hypothetical protein KF729_28355 [Sandaracinaceae bacterium]|nr:hypothetical protein [Sandaracinaceae bacterium]